MKNSRVLDHYRFSFESIDWGKYPVRRIVEDVKEDVPKEFRDYDPKTGIWTIDCEYIDTVREIWAYHRQLHDAMQKYDGLLGGTPTFIRYDEETQSTYMVVFDGQHEYILDKQTIMGLFMGMMRFYEHYDERFIERRNELERRLSGG